MTLKILVNGPKINNFSGGQATHIKNLIDAFRFNRKVCVDHFINTEALQDKELIIKKILRNIFLIVPFLRIIKNYHILHINATFDDKSIVRESLYAFLGGTLFGKKVIWQFHGGSPSEVFFFKTKILKKIIEYLFIDAKQILLLSETQIISFNYLFPSLTNVKKVHNYIDTGGVEEIINHKLIKENEIITFLFLARLHRDKGIKELVSASEMLRTKNNKFKILICGDGPEKSWIENRLKVKEISQYIDYMGVVIDNDKELVLNQSDVMVMPTKHKEGVPYSILEAFKHGIPVISCNQGAICEMISDGENGYIVEPDDIESICDRMMCLCNKITLHKMVLNARHTALSKFDISSMKRLFLNIYALDE